jgi:hypothetical protein
MSSYLSSGFGRDNSGFSTPDACLSEMKEIPYVRATLFDVVQALSDPSNCWLDRLQGPRRLKLHERHYSIRLLKLLKGYYETLDSCRLLDVGESGRREAQMALVRVFRNLADWDSVLWILDGLLRFDCVRAWCGGAGREFWELASLEHCHGGTETSQAGAPLTATSIRKWDDALVLPTSRDTSADSTGTPSFLHMLRSISATKSNVPWIKQQTPSREHDDPWMTQIGWYARELSASRGSENFLKKLGERTTKKYGSSEGERIRDETLPSGRFALFILTEHEMADISDCLLSDVTDQALLAGIVCFKTVGRLSDPRFKKLEHRIKSLQGQVSVLVKSLGRLALIIDLGNLRPATIPVPGSDAGPQPTRYVESIDSYPKRLQLTRCS